MWSLVFFYSSPHVNKQAHRTFVWCCGKPNPWNTCSTSYGESSPTHPLETVFHGIANILFILFHKKSECTKNEFLVARKIYFAFYTFSIVKAVAQITLESAFIHLFFSRKIVKSRNTFMQQIKFYVWSSLFFVKKSGKSN